jgi:adenylate cyclase class IV
LATELELKAVVPDPEALRHTLRAAGAREAFCGMLRDRRFDRQGELEGLDHILRLRRWIPREGTERVELGWKGPMALSAEGYKCREEIEIATSHGPDALRLIEALGYRITHAIDRYVELYLLDGAAARLEWYPRMDVLVEIEGTPGSMERLIAVAGLPRSSCVPDALAHFAVRYEARTGRRAVLSEALLGDEQPGWSAA